MATYVGYIVSDTDCNPFKVFIPALNGFFSYGMRSADGFGSNANKWDTVDLQRMQQSATLCYQTSELSSGSDYDFNSDNGYVTVEENLGELNDDTATDVTYNAKASIKTSCPVDDGPFYTGNESPAANYMVNYRPSPGEKTYFPSYMNSPGGSFTTMSIGTRVLVNYPGGGSIGYIISQIPGPDTFSQTLVDPRVEK